MQEVGSECLDDPDMHQIEHGCDSLSLKVVTTDW